uniref:Mannosyltransferase n=1 Tax=Timema monikensis TaxID=170555 RepID=A0A7R9EC37_9NEOP|nr:unnamed protein product [Timema monikensis]
MMFTSKLDHSLAPYWLWAGLRILFTVWPQSGYIHPDEFFQSVEVIAGKIPLSTSWHTPALFNNNDKNSLEISLLERSYASYLPFSAFFFLKGDVFDIEVARPWEFNTTFPLRSIALPYLTAGIPLILIKILSPFLLLWFNCNLKTSYVLLITPRLVTCMLSFVSDYCLYRICKVYGQNYRTRLITFATSYVVLVYGTRTFSNTIEMTFTSLLLYFVADCMAHSDQVIQQEEFLSDKYKEADSPVERVKLYKIRSALPSHSLSRCFALASITVLGTFNRPTFIAFAFPPIFFWLQRGLGSKIISLHDFHLRMLLFILSGVPTAVFLIMIDSFYYGYLTMGEIAMMKLGPDNLVVTPVNFIKYNMNSSNLAHHGLHPRYVHFLINIPLLYNVLGVVGVTAVLRIIYRGICKRWSDLPRVQSIIGLMTLSFLIPIGLLSLFPHQEARFLIPVTVPLVFLYAQHIRHIPSTECRQEQGKTHFFFVKGSQEELTIKPRLTTIHLVTSHIYSMPLFLLQLRNSKRPLFSKQTGQRYRLAQSFYSYEMGSDSLETVHHKLVSILKSCEEIQTEKKLDYRLFVAVPASLLEKFDKTVLTFNSSFSYSVSKVFYPHVSTEALPTLSFENECQLENMNLRFCKAKQIYLAPLQYFSKLAHQFGLALLEMHKLAL